MALERLEEMEAAKTAAIIEINGHRFYNYLASQVADPEAQKVLRRLAADEEKHRAVIEGSFFKGAGLGEQITAEELSVEGGIEKRGKADIFTKRINVEGLLKRLDSPRKALILALDTERYSVGFFEDLASRAKSSEARAIYSALAEEEKGHVKEIEALLASLD